MKRILIVILLFLVLLAGFVYAKEISASVNLRAGQGIIFFDKKVFPINIMSEDFGNKDFDLMAGEACEIPFTLDGMPKVRLRLKELPILKAKMIYMGNGPLESYEDCSRANSGKITQISTDGVWKFAEADLTGNSGKLSEGDVYCSLTNDGKNYVKVKILMITQGAPSTSNPEVGLDCCGHCYVALDYVLQDDGTPYFGSKALQPSEPVKVESSISAKAPNVVTKRVTAGTINVQDGEIVFEIINEDPNHKLEGYLSCDIPSDVIVTGSMGAATGEQAQYIGQTFTVDPAPARESMSLRLSSQNEGSKNVRCSINYVLFKEGKGYVTIGGQYSSDKNYQQIIVNRDIQFKEFEDKTKSDIATYWYFIAGVGVVVLLLIIFLVYKLGHVSGKVEKKE